MSEADLEIDYIDKGFNKQNSIILKKIQNEQINAIKKEYLNLVKKTEKRIKKKIKHIPKLFFIDSFWKSTGEYITYIGNYNIGNYNNQNIIYETIRLNIKKDKNMLKPTTKIFKETIEHEICHAIHLQNNKKLLKYNICFKPKTNKELKDSFTEGFAQNLYCHKEYKKSKSIIKNYQRFLLKKIDHDKIDLKYMLKLIKNTEDLKTQHRFGSFIFEEIKRLKGNKFVLEYAFKKSGFRPEDMQTDYEKFCGGKNEKPIPYLQLIKDYEQKISDISLKTITINELNKLKNSLIPQRIHRLKL